jgi:glycosyltransferase involved in cell wall biosynthesis
MPLLAEISVVIPVYNGAAYLAEAVESVRRQTCPPSRIILVDDGSTDETPQVAFACGDERGTPVEYVRRNNAGPSAAMNYGAALVKSGLIAFHSADDIWLPNKIALQLSALEDGADLVFGCMQHFISPELDVATAETLQCPPGPMPAYSAGTLLTRLETFCAVGLFNESFRIGEFLDWYSRATDRGMRSTMLPQVVSMRRLHGRNHSLTRKTHPQGYADVLKAVLDRRREGK